MSKYNEPIDSTTDYTSAEKWLRGPMNTAAQYTVRPRGQKKILVTFPCVDPHLAVRTAAQYNTVFGGGVDLYKDGQVVFEGLHGGNIEEACQNFWTEDANN